MSYQDQQGQKSHGPQAAQQPAYLPQPSITPAARSTPKRGSSVNLIAFLGVVAVIIMIVVASLLGINFGSSEDASVTGCSTEAQFDRTYGVATVEITNHGDSARSYVVTVAFESSDGSQQYGTSPVTANDLAPGQSTTQTTPATVEVPSGLACKVTHVSTF